MILRPIIRELIRPSMAQLGNRAGGGFNPASLFAAGEPGFHGEVYNPLTYTGPTGMYQDSAGTTPVTAVEQPVGLWRDWKRGRGTTGGNDATQATAASRPTLSARYNQSLLSRNIGGTMTTAVPPTANAAQWTYDVAQGDPRTNNTAVGPDGIATAATLTFTAGGSFSLYAQYTGLTSGVSYKFSIKVMLGTATNFCVVAHNTLAWNSLTGEREFTAADGLNTSTYTTVSITTVADAQGKINLHLGRHGETLTQQTVGTVFVCEHDFRTSNDAALSIPAYQRVNTATDYDTSGFVHYLRFDGVDDSLATPSINFSALDKMTLWAGLTKLTDSGTQVIAELGINTSAGVLGNLLLYTAGAANYKVAASQAALNDSTFSTFTAPNSSVLTVAVDFAQGAANEILGRFNGISVASTGATDAGTGTFANATLNFGRRNNLSLPSSVRLTSITYRGVTAATGASQVSQMEAYLARLAGQVL